MGMIQEFKEFAVKGNAMDLAVGVIIGGAFGRIVDSIVGDLIMPLVSRVVGMLDFSNLFVVLGDNPNNLATLADLNLRHLFATLALAACAWIPAAPVHAGALTDYAENKLLDALMRAQSLGAPATQYIGLATDTCSDSTAGAEPWGGAYARVAVTAGLTAWAGTQAAASTTASSGSGGTTSNNAAITWPASAAAWGNLQSARMYDASTAGNSWWCINLTTPLNVSGSGFTVSFPAASLQFQIDN